jgi:hypothetical protein
LEDLISLKKREWKIVKRIVNTWLRDAIAGTGTLNNLSAKPEIR